MAKKWLKKAIKKMKARPRTKKAKALKKRLGKGGDIYKSHILASTEWRARDQTSTLTESVLAFKPPEPDLVPYECSRSSGVLSFWDNPDEDIYTLYN